MMRRDLGKKSLVTYCARAKLLNLIDEKFGVFFKYHPHGSIEIEFLSGIPSGGWVLVEKTPRIFLDLATYKSMVAASSIDFDFKCQEFIIRKENELFT